MRLCVGVCVRLVLQAYCNVHNAANSRRRNSGFGDSRSLLPDTFSSTRVWRQTSFQLWGNAAVSNTVGLERLELALKKDRRIRIAFERD